MPASHPRLRGCTASWIWRRRAGGREGQRSSYARACDAVQFWGDEQIWIEGSRRREEGRRRLWRAPVPPCLAGGAGDRRKSSEAMAPSSLFAAVRDGRNKVNISKTHPSVHKIEVQVRW